MVDQVLQLEERSKIQLLAPVVTHRKGAHEKLIDDISKRDMYVCVLMAKLLMLMKCRI